MASKESVIENKKLSIIVPVFNESKTIKKILELVSSAYTLDYKKEIIVVDDGSSDGTEEILEDLKKEFDFLLLRHSKNSGKGSAIRTALDRISGDVALIQDADLEYNPSCYPALLRKLKEPGVDVVYGARQNRLWQYNYIQYILGAKILTLFINLLFHSKLKDSYTCYKLIPASILKSLCLESPGFEIEAEITTKLLKKGYKIKETPIEYSPRSVKQGKKIKVYDGLIGLWTIIKNRV